MKKLLALLLVLPLLAFGSDITRNVTFSDGSRLSASGLHGLLDTATISPTFYTRHDTATSLDGSDYFLVSSSPYTDFRKITASAALYANTALITSPAEDYAPQSADYVLTYDASGAALAKVRLANLLSTNLYSGQPAVTNFSLLTAGIPIFQSDTNGMISPSNLFARFPYLAPFTNVGTSTSVNTNDTLLIWDNLGGTNKQVTLKNAGIGSSFTTTNITLTAGTTFQIPHGLGQTPSQQRWVFVCVTNTLGGYVPGDEVPASGVMTPSGSYYVQGATYGANSSNVWLGLVTPVLGTTNFMVNKTNPTTVVSMFDTNRWQAKGYFSK